MVNPNEREARRQIKTGNRKSVNWAPDDSGNFFVFGDEKDEILKILDTVKTEFFSCLSDANVSTKYPDAYSILDEDKLVGLILKWFGSGKP